MIPQAALELLNETITSTISASQSQSQSLTENESNTDNSSFGTGGIEIMIAIGGLATVMLAAGYWFYKYHAEDEDSSSATTNPEVPLRESQRRRQAADIEKQRLLQQNTNTNGAYGTVDTTNSSINDSNLSNQLTF